MPVLNKRALYIHIPFCRKKCPYCAFYSVSYDKSAASSYIDTVSGLINSVETGFSTIYIGGGTPTVLDVGLLKKLLGSLKRHSAGTEEFTIEVNPESLDGEKLALFLDNGINRISIGAQSFNDNKLKRLGRAHDAVSAKNAVELAGKKGFKNISIDLIFGVPDETESVWKKDLETAAALPVRHVSCYSLTHEKDIKPIDDDTTAQFYERAISYLESKGFKQYEISNFALKGCECRHNMNYWDAGPYIGLGPSAVSYSDGLRSENVHDVDEYIKRGQAAFSAVVSSEKLQPDSRARETAAVKIRTMEGIDFEWFRQKTGFDFLELEKDAVRRLSEDALIECRDGSARLTRRGILFCDVVSSSFL